MVKQFEHNYAGFNGVESRCNIMIFSDDGEHFICFEDLNIGLSVTNGSEILATEIVHMCGFNPSDCRFFETYRQYDHNVFDEIEYNWQESLGYEKKQWKATNPRWKPASDEIQELFLG